MSAFSERVAAVALAQFDALPSKSKPRTHADGRREWTPMSAIVLAEARGTAAEVEVLTCVSLATGTKCLPLSSIAKCQGTVLHDSHAEVLALRAFNRFLLAEIEHVLCLENHRSRWIELRHESESGWTGTGSQGKPFRLRPGVNIHMFSTEAPCGDASMDLLIASKAHEDTELWPEPISDIPQLCGRGYFSVLGAVRRKPARGDAEPTLSKSCTDKLALKQFTSTLAFPASLFVETTPNAYLKSMILPSDSYDAEGFARAFAPHGRLAARTMLAGTSNVPVMHPFEIETLPSEDVRFAFEKTFPTADSVPTKASNVSACWARGLRAAEPLINETLVNGVKQGAKQFSEAAFKMSAVCRKNMWQQVRQIVGLLQQSDGAVAFNREYVALLEGMISVQTYKDAKANMLDRDRAAAKEHAMALLGGWERNEGDDDWAS